MMYWDNQYVKFITRRLWSFADYIYLDQSYNLLLRIFCTSLIVAVGFFVTLLYARQYALRILLSYRGWMCKYVYVWGYRFDFKSSYLSDCNLPQYHSITPKKPYIECQKHHKMCFEWLKIVLCKRR